MTHDLARRSLSAFLWNYAGGGGKIVAQLLIQIALARILGPAIFGQYSAVLIVLGIGWLFADSGFGLALIQKRKLEESDVRQALGWTLLLASIATSVIVFLAPWISEQFTDRSLIPMIRISAGLVFLLALSNISSSLMRRELDMKRLQIIQIGAYLIGFGGVAMGLAMEGYGAWSLIIGFGVQTFLTLVGGYVVVQHSLRPRLSGDGKLRDFGAKVMAVNIVNWAIENLDRFLVGKFWGVQALGMYTVAFNLSRSPVAVMVSSFQTVAFSSVSRIQEDKERIRKGYLAILSVLAMSMFPFFAVIAYEANTVIQIVYGKTWNSAAPLLAAFAYTTPIYALGAVTGSLLCARSAVGKEFNSQLLTLCILLIGFILLRDEPLAHAVWIVPSAYTLRYVFLVMALRRNLEIPPHHIIRVLSGGILIAISGIIVDMILRSVWKHSVAWTNLIPLLGAIAATLLLISMAGKKLIGRELQAILESRREESHVIQIFCRVLGLPGGRAGQ